MLCNKVDSFGCVLISIAKGSVPETVVYAALHHMRAGWHDKGFCKNRVNFPFSGRCLYPGLTVM